MLYAGLDQGNRLDWLNSGLICGLLAGRPAGGLAFVLRELIPRGIPGNLSFLLQRNIALLVMCRWLASGS